MSYKVLSEDAKSFHIQHPDGSSFKVAKKGLGKSVLKKISNLSSEVQHFAEGGEVQDVAGSSIDSLLGPSPQAQSPSPLVTPAPQPTAQPEGLTPLDTRAPASAAPGIPQATPQALAGAMKAAPSPMDLMGQMNRATGTQMAGIKQTADAQTMAAENTAKAYDDFQKQLAERDVLWKQKEADYQKEHDQLFKAVSEGQIDPKKLWNNASTPSKVSATLGIILGGIGQGLIGGENQGLAMVNKLIDRDVEAQKANLGKQQNLLTLNMQKYRDMTMAEQATRAQLLTTVQAQAQKFAAQAQSQEAQGRAKMLTGELMKAQIPLQQSLIQSQLVRSLAGGNGVGINPEMLPADVRERAVMVPGPNGQKMLRTAPTKEAAENFRKAEIETSTIGHKIDDAIAFATNKGFSPNPWGSDHAQAESLRNSILSSMAALHGLNRLTKEELDDMYKGMVPNPGDLNQAQVLTKLQHLKDLVTQRQNADYASYVQGYDPGSIPQSAPVRGAGSTAPAMPAYQPTFNVRDK